MKFDCAVSEELRLHILWRKMPLETTNFHKILLIGIIGVAITNVILYLDSFAVKIIMPPRSKIVFVLSVILSSETLTLLISFEQWVLELWYFTWILPVIRPFRGYHYFLPCDLDLGVWRLTLLITFKQWVLDLWYSTWISLVIRPFRGYDYFLTFDLDLGVWPIFFGKL